MEDAQLQRRRAHLDAVVAVLRHRHTGTPAAVDRAERRLRGYFDTALTGDLLARQPHDLYGAAMSHWALAQRRHAEEAVVRAYNPDVERDGWNSGHSVLDIVTDDMAFIVDSVLAALETRGYQIHSVVHPTATVERDDDGRLVDIDRTDDRPPNESFVHVEFDRIGNAELDNVAEVVHIVLDDVRVAVDDYPAMRDRALTLAAELRARERSTDLADAAHDDPAADDPVEVAEFLEWLADGAFVFIGARDYDLIDDGDEAWLVPRAGSGLGVLWDDTPDRRPLSAAAAAAARRPTVVNLTKTNATSTVHRAVPLDYIGVKELGPSGEVTGERRILGLFTSAAYTSPVASLPIVRRKVAATLERSAFQPKSHDLGRLQHAIETFPRDELFQVSTDELVAMTNRVLEQRDRRRVTLLVRREAFGRFLSCLVYVPRDRFTTDVRLKIQAILMEVFGGLTCQYSTQVGNEPHARLHLVIYVSPDRPLPPFDALEDRLTEVVRGWEDLLRSSLIERFGETVGLELLARYRGSMGNDYRESTAPALAASDIAHLETLDDDGFGVVVTNPLETPPTELRCRLYRRGEAITLSGFVPLLHDLGAVVTDERPSTFLLDEDTALHIYDIGLRFDVEPSADDRQRLADTIAAVWHGATESDQLSTLVVRAQMSWYDVAVLRAYGRYVAQLIAGSSAEYIRETVADHPTISARLTDLFGARFHPDRHDAAAEARLHAEITAAIDEVSSLDADRILRSLLAAILATVRTNAWQPHVWPLDGSGTNVLAVKVQPGLIPGAPKPVPMAEIFVFGPRVEGVHLRAWLVSRGGLRHSDRSEDYRTEILGLMKAQAVKNSVIVPDGAKGGFVVRARRRLSTPEDDTSRPSPDDVVAAYRQFIGALLDLTDNRLGDTVTGPPRTVRHDGDDPYLVIAADKGTARFSDVANEIALSRAFWLGDAFASGGSSGYDHKALGITARGAWRSVRRHLRELGRDAESDIVSCVGIGDMSGDVFGNGMQQSHHIRLVAAFDHRHVFLDPDPDVERADLERRRLFALPTSSWDDFDRDIISAGGGVWSRRAKTVPISPAARLSLGLEDDVEHLTPDELISAILRAPVDLIWNGGIGTYIKASDETNADIGDRANDGVRVDASELRCIAIGEGGNLGLSQRARVEFALAGGRVNTDAIDNSAGVDCSDHEVNLKIVLDRVVDAGELTPRQRNEVLASLADQVCDAVLSHNEAQNRTLATLVAQSAALAEPHERLMQWLGEHGGLDRDVEALPSTSALDERRRRGGGLVCPELAVLMAYLKNALTDLVNESDLIDHPTAETDLRSYFPPDIVERFGPWVDSHPLRRDIISTVIANAFVDRSGLTMGVRLMEETSADVGRLVLAHRAAWRIFALEPLWTATRSLDHRVPPETQTRIDSDIKRLAERGTRWVLTHSSGDPSDLVDRLLDPIAEASLVLRSHVDSDPYELGAAGEAFGRGLIEQLAVLDDLYGCLDLVDRVRVDGLDVDSCVEVAFRLDAVLDLDSLERSIVALARADEWDTLARGSLRDRFFAARAELVRHVLRSAQANRIADDADAMVDEWLDHAGDAGGRFGTALSDGPASLARVSVAVSRLETLATTRASRSASTPPASDIAPDGDGAATLAPPCPGA